MLGLLFLRHADEQFAAIEKKLSPRVGSRVKPGPDAYKAEGAIFLPPESRFGFLLSLPKAQPRPRSHDRHAGNRGQESGTRGRVAETYQAIPDDVLAELLRALEPLKIAGDAFGHVYEHFMGNFAKGTVQKSGEFYTPASIVRLIVEVLEPYLTGAFSIPLAARPACPCIPPNS